MPRRRPSQVRAAVRRSRRRDGIPLPGLSRGSSALAAAISRWERRERYERGTVARALRGWESMARRPGRYRFAYGCPCCDPVYHRQLLEDLLHEIPARPARELRRWLEPFDGLLLRRTSPDPFAPDDAAWWKWRCAD